MLGRHLGGFPVSLNGSRILRSNCLQRLCSSVENVIGEDGKDDVDLISLIDEISTGLERFPPCLIYRIAEDPSGNERKPYGFAAIFHSQLQRSPVCPIEQLRLVVLASRPNGAYGVDYVFRLQIKARRDHSRASIAMADLVAGGLQLLVARRLEDRPADAAACPQSIICRIDDGICI